MVEALTAAHHDTIRAFLRAQSTLALATVDESGKPKVAPLFFVSDDNLNLYWLSSPNSRHSLNLITWGEACATIYPTVWEWNEIRGLQIEGRARFIDDHDERESILALYRQKFTLPASFDSLITLSTLYALTPTWIRWLDNTTQFGFRAEGDVS